jgi:hypothetical protein
MLIASCDIETTGLDPSYCQVLEVGLILWETSDLTTPVAELPTFHCYVVHEQTVGQPSALSMNKKVLGRIGSREPGFRYLKPEDVGHAIRKFADRLVPQEPSFTLTLKPTGFNFDSFDRQFLNLLPTFSDYVKFKHRSLAPATLYFDPFRDTDIPGSDEVFRRAGVKVRDRHTALGDAAAVIEVLRAAFRRGQGPETVPLPPRCPDCGGRRTIVVDGGEGWGEIIPCPKCDPRDESAANPMARYIDSLVAV